MTFSPGIFASWLSVSSAIPSAKYSWSFFSLMSVKGNTAMDLSLTTFAAVVVGCFVAACFVSQNLPANIAVSVATTASPAATRIRLRRDLDCAAEAVPL